MRQGKKLLKILVSFLILISFTVTAVVGFVFINNYGELSQLIQVGALVKSNFLWKVSGEQLIEGATRGLVDSLQDEYSVFMNKEEFEELTAHIQGVFGGVGIYVGMKDDKITVIAPIEGTPGYKAGIKKGDIIVKINNQNTANMTLDDAVKVMKGEPGTEVSLTIQRPAEGKLYDYTVVREIIDVPTVKGEILEKNPEIAYIQMTMFASNTDEAFKNELAKLEKKAYKGLIIDLRNNPGGDLESVVNVVGQLIPKGPIVHVVDNKGNTQTFDSPGPGLQKPIAVLIDEGSASASEIMAGAIKDSKTGVLIGETTFGKGIVQSVYFLGSGAGLKLTTAKYLTPLKKDIHKKGIEPDIKVSLPDFVPGEEFVKDTQLEKAIQYIQGQI